MHQELQKPKVFSQFPYKEVDGKKVMRQLDIKLKDIQDVVHEKYVQISV